MCIRDRLTAAQNRVETAAAIVGAVDPAKVVDPLSGANSAERAWHYPVSYTHLRAHETVLDLVCRLLLEKKKQDTETPVPAELQQILKHKSESAKPARSQHY